MVDLVINKKEIWSKGRIVPGADPDLFRKDDYGYWIKYEEFLTGNKMAWDLEKRYSQDSSEPDLRPVARIRLKRIFQEVEKAIEEKMGPKGSAKNQ